MLCGCVCGGVIILVPKVCCEDNTNNVFEIILVKYYEL